MEVIEYPTRDTVASKLALSGSNGTSSQSISEKSSY